jgi:hypothetical protein
VKVVGVALAVAGLHRPKLRAEGIGDSDYQPHIQISRRRRDEGAGVSLKSSRAEPINLGVNTKCQLTAGSMEDMPKPHR